MALCWWIPLDSFAKRLDGQALVEKELLFDAAEAMPKACKDQRLVWLEHRVLFDCVVSLVEDHLCAQSRGPEADSLDALEQLLNAAAALHSLDRGREVVLGVRAEDLEMSDAVQRHAQVTRIQRSVIPLVEARLHRQLSAVTSFAGVADPSALLHATSETITLRERVKAEGVSLDTSYRALLSLQETAVSELCDAVQSLKHGQYDEWDRVHAQWLAAQGSAMASKMRLLELRLLRDTYTGREAVQALRQMDHDVSAAQRALVEKRAEISERRLRFEQAGMEKMQALASEYAQVLKSIEETRWAIAELTSGKMKM